MVNVMNNIDENSEINIGIGEECVDDECSPSMVIFHGNRIANLEKATIENKGKLEILQKGQEALDKKLSDGQRNQEEMLKSLQQLKEWAGIKDVQNGYIKEEMDELKGKKQKSSDNKYNFIQGLILVVSGAICGQILAFLLHI